MIPVRVVSSRVGDSRQERPRRGDAHEPAFPSSTPGSVTPVVGTLGTKVFRCGPCDADRPVSEPIGDGDGRPNGTTSPGERVYEFAAESEDAVYEPPEVKPL